MGKNQLEIFCTTEDLVTILDMVHRQVSLSFAVAGLFETATVQLFQSAADVSTFIAASGDTTLNLLVVDSGSTVSTREVPQRKGGTRYGVDQVCNPRSVVLRPGRLVDERTLLAGQIGTASADPASVGLFSAFSGVVRKQFVKVKSYWVGPEALRILDAGGRLTSTPKAPPEYDLKR